MTNWMEKKWFSIVLLILASVIWGSSFVVVKDSLSFITPIWQLALRLLVACIALWGLFYKQIKKRTKKILRQGIFLGALLFFAFFFQNLGTDKTTAGNSGFITCAYVAIVPFFSWILRRKCPRFNQFIAAFISLAGVGILSLDGKFTIHAGDFLLMICALFYAIHIVFVDEGDKNDPPILLHMLQISTATVLSVIAAFVMEPIPQTISLHCGISIIYCGIFEIMIGFLFQLIGQKNTSQSLASILMSLECVFSAIFAVIFLGEPLSSKLVFGGLCIFAAILISQYEPKKS